MAARRDLVIIGGGHNGLVAACLLARAGLKPLVLERRPVPGGGALTQEIHPGFRCPVLAHAAGPFSPVLAQELGLARHGLEPIRTDVRLYAPAAGGGGGLVIYEDPARTAREMAGLSAGDAARYPEFAAAFQKIGAFLRGLLPLTPPALTEKQKLAELWRLLQVGRGFRSLGRKDAYRLLRWGPMAVADLAQEWFQHDLLRAVVSARGVLGTFAGPWSAGTSVGVLMQAALDGQAVAPSATYRGGIGALADSLAAAARTLGVEIRTGALVRRIQVSAGRATGVVLESGEEISARAIVSNADPRSTMLGLVDPLELDPDFAHKLRNYRCTGTVAKVNLALSALPAFGAAGAGTLSGRIHIGPEIDFIERAFDAAKYGGFSPRPFLDVSIPSIADPSLAPKGAHVMSIQVQYAPYRLKEGSWDQRRGELGDAVLRTLAEYAPDLPSRVVKAEILTPADLEAEWGLSGGHILHGEPSLDQIFTMRPILGWARYRTPISGLYLCGAGTHPGGGLTGLPGANAAREIARDLASR